jgi:hypothetical protein
LTTPASSAGAESAVLVCGVYPPQECRQAVAAARSLLPSGGPFVRETVTVGPVVNTCPGGALDPTSCADQAIVWFEDATGVTHRVIVLRERQDVPYHPTTLDPVGFDESSGVVFPGAYGYFPATWHVSYPPPPPAGQLDAIVGYLCNVDLDTGCATADPRSELPGPACSNPIGALPPNSFVASWLRAAPSAVKRALAAKNGGKIAVTKIRRAARGTCASLGGYEELTAFVGPLDTYSVVACLTGPRINDLEAKVRAMLGLLLYLANTR